MEDCLISEKYRRTRRCTQCGLYYKEKDNLGRLHCHTHPGLRLCENESQRAYYSCCGQYAGAWRDDYDESTRGCLALDHTDEALNDGAICERLLQLRNFAVMTLPTLLLQHGVAPPMPTQRLYDQARDRSRRLSKLDITLDALSEAAQHHSQLASDHDPYRCNLTLNYEADRARLAQEIAGAGTLSLEEVRQELQASPLGQLLRNEHANASASRLLVDRTRAEESQGWPDSNRLRRKTTGDASASTVRRDRHRIEIDFLVVQRIDSALRVVGTHFKQVEATK
jgi:hypothetical protein